MLSMIRIWLLIWVISDMMVFKMHAIQNNKEVNHNESRTTTTAPIDDDDDDDENFDNDHAGIILNLYKPYDNSTNENDKRQNDSSKQTETPFMQLVIKNPDKTDKSHQRSQSTTKLNNSAKSVSASVESSIKHKTETQQKIIIRYVIQFHAF